LGMRTHRLNDDMLSRHASHESASESSDSDESDSAASNAVEETLDDEENADMSDTASEPEDRSTNLNITGQDQDATDLLSDNSRSANLTTGKTHSKKSSLSSKRSRSSKKNDSLPSGPASKAAELSKSNLKALDRAQAEMDDSSPEESPESAEIESLRGRSGVPQNAPEVDAVQFDERSTRDLYADRGQQPPSRSSSPENFTFSPIPQVKVSNDDAGPSIMFADEPRPPRTRPTDVSDPGANHSRPRSIYQRNVDTSSLTGAASASGFPSSASIPLSFNDLPSRAQHLILNELITQQSEDTAVVFTTLPAPVEGTYRSESDSLRYISDLEVLCGGLPPTLMVHSNSMTVTTNL
jgi:solute carrier family 12 (potassium/chloride transporters), member 9